jgi:hypothetical protein
MQTYANQVLRKFWDSVLKFEIDRNYNHDSAVILSGQNLKCGAVLGRRLVGATAVAAAAAGNTGNGAMGSVTVDVGGQRGRYTVIITEPGANAGEFEVRDPKGALCGQGTVAVAFDNNQLNFTLADGGTDFAVGDAFYIDVFGGTYKYLEYDPAGSADAANPVAILTEDVDAATVAADVANILVTTRGPAIVADAGLVWKTGLTANQKAAAIALLETNTGIIVRPAY